MRGCQWGRAEGPTDCFTTSAHSGGTPYSGFSCRKRDRSFRGGAKAPPTYGERRRRSSVGNGREAPRIFQVGKGRSRTRAEQEEDGADLAGVSPVDDLHTLLAC